MRVLFSALFLLLSLSGCASRWVVDAEVRSFPNMAGVPANASYRFERLPSQQTNETAQQQLESWAETALSAVGLRRDDQAAQLSALIGARVSAAPSPWDDPWMRGGAWGGWGPGWNEWGPGWGGWGPGWPGAGWHGSSFGPPRTPWFRHEVSIVLRELPSNRIVYESHANSEGPNSNSAFILPLMFQAALQGFPNAPPGDRRVRIEAPQAAR